jgi:hypothetical protein
MSYLIVKENLGLARGWIRFDLDGFISAVAEIVLTLLRREAIEQCPDGPRSGIHQAFALAAAPGTAHQVGGLDASRNTKRLGSI